MGANCGWGARAMQSERRPAHKRRVARRGCASGWRHQTHKRPHSFVLVHDGEASLVVTVAPRAKAKSGPELYPKTSTHVRGTLWRQVSAPRVLRWPSRLSQERWCSALKQRAHYGSALLPPSALRPFSCEGRMLLSWCAMQKWCAHAQTKRAETQPHTHKKKENRTERDLTPRLLYMKQSCLHQPTVPEYLPHLLTHTTHIRKSRRGS